MLEKGRKCNKGVGVFLIWRKIIGETNKTDETIINFSTKPIVELSLAAHGMKEYIKRKEKKKKGRREP